MDNRGIETISNGTSKRSGCVEKSADDPILVIDSTFREVRDVLGGLCEMDEQEEIERLYHIRKVCKKEEGSKRPKCWPHPTPKILEEHVDRLIATKDGSCKVYKNGFAVYTNRLGRKTVLWLDDCACFRYHFVEVEGDMPSTADLDEDLLGQQPWYIAVALRGEHKIEHNRFLGRAGRKDEGGYEEGGYEEGMSDEEEDEKWFGAYRYEGPEIKLEKKEMFQELMEDLPEKQREVCIAYYVLGFNQEEIGEGLGISRQAVGSRLKSVDLRLGKKGVDLLERSNDLAEYVDGYLSASFQERLMEVAQSADHKYRVVKRKKIKKG